MINGQEEYRLDYSSNAFSPPMSFSLGFSFFFFGYYVFVLFFCISIWNSDRDDVFFDHRTLAATRTSPTTAFYESTI